MQLPRALKGFNLFVEGTNLHGLVVDINRPKITRKTDAYTPGGGMVEMEIEQGLDKLEIEVTCKGYTAEVLRAMKNTIAGTVLRYQGALQRDDDEGFLTLTGEARGRIIEADPGGDKQGESGEHKFKIALVYWKETLAGEDLIEVDALGNKFVVAGNDQRAALRKALGL